MDESENSSADESAPSSGSAGAKKKARTRTRTAKPRKAKATAAESGSAPELPFEATSAPEAAVREPSEPRAPIVETADTPRAPRARFTPRREAPAPEPASQEPSAPLTSREESSVREESRPRTEDAPRPEAPSRAEDARQDSGAGESRREASEDGPRSEGGGETPPTPAPAEPREAREGRPQHGHGHKHHGGQGGGHAQDRGHAHGGDQGGDRNEPFWKRDKRNKRKRGKHGGGGWQPGGGGGGGGGEPKHPPQPPPPSFTPVYGDLPAPDRFADLAALAARAEDVSSNGGDPLSIEHLYALNLGELTAEVRRLQVPIDGAPNRKQLLGAIFRHVAETKRPLVDRGWLDLTDKGHGFIVHEAVNYRLYPEDAYVPESLIRHYGLKRGHLLEVQLEAPREGERCPSVVRVKSVMGMPPDEISKVTPFEELVPYYPLQRILLEAPEVHKDVSMRAVDILTPVGFGQRGLIVAPPRTGKTVLLQNMANSVSENFPDAKLILLLIDERPEEVTDFKRHTRGEVVSSTFDESPESHVHCAEMVGEKARRLVEMGQHVVILLDSITRLARAYNALASNSGKIMSGGMEATALQRPKRFFGAARNIEGGGSLTIMATALVDTGSRMDEVIFEEFKGTGNMELHLDRGLVDKRIFPAINMDRSGTRKEELIYHPEEMLRIHGLRRAMQGIPPIEAMEMLLNRLKKTKTNAEFLFSLNR